MKPNICLILIGLVWWSSVVVQNGSTGNLLQRTIDAINGSLDFSHHQQQHQTIDGILGAFIVQSQTDSLIRIMEKIYENASGFGESLSRRLLFSLKMLNWHARDTVLRSWRQIFANDDDHGHHPSTKYSQITASLLNRNLWSQIHCRSRRLNPKTFGLNGTAARSERLKENLSDICLNEVFAHCQISTFCWKLFATQHHQYHGYALAHQVLYLSAMETMKCYERISPMEIDQRINNHCYSLYQENREIEKRHYPQQDQDLFLENVAFCALNGFSEFRNRADWLEKILSWQDWQTGCYRIDLRLLERYIRRGKGRFNINIVEKRRESISLPDGCSWHKTSVAQAAMAILLQQMVIDRLHNVDRKPPFHHQWCQ